MNYLSLIGRENELFKEDILNNELNFAELIKNSKCLVIGGAGSIGQAVSIEIIKRNPKILHIVDISENNLVEIVRDIRSSQYDIDTDLRTFAIDCGSKEFEALINKESSYDFVFNLSALKHVRSEKDPYTLMRMINVNIINTINTIKLIKKSGCKKYFCVSTDKAANPVNMMGGSKKIMEMFLMRESLEQQISMARFANVAFSDGSLLHGFNQRILKHQPIAAPNDIKRYFVTPKESGELCLLSAMMGENRDIFFPKLDDNLHLIKFSSIAKNYLNNLGYEAYECRTEEEARSRTTELISQNKWPCYFFKSDTTGEKSFEEFFTDNEELDLDSFKSIGIIHNEASYDEDKLDYFIETINQLRNKGNWTKDEIIKLYFDIIPQFDYIDKGKYLDEKM